jgi:hypothetical protein
MKLIHSQVNVLSQRSVCIRLVQLDWLRTHLWNTSAQGREHQLEMIVTCSIHASAQFTYSKYHQVSHVGTTAACVNLVSKNYKDAQYWGKKHQNTLYKHTLLNTVPKHTPLNTLYYTLYSRRLLHMHTN